MLHVALECINKVFPKRTENKTQRNIGGLFHVEVRKGNHGIKQNSIQERANAPRSRHSSLDLWAGGLRAAAGYELMTIRSKHRKKEGKQEGRKEEKKDGIK